MKMSTFSKVLLAVILWGLAVGVGHSCPVVVHSEMVIPIIGGYRHESRNNLLRKPGEPARIHRHYLIVFDYQFDIAGRVEMVAGVVLMSVLVVSLCLIRRSS